WGAGRKFAPIATGDHKAPAAKEGFVSFLLLSLSVAVVIGVGIVIIGL
ncbi:hydrogenase, partial [Mycolicibacterium smegmatis]